jgi:serine/threonine protein kinase
MGEVFTARDTRLNRTVAIKVLPKHFSERADLRQRLEREAWAIASLNHPNICALHDIGRQDGIDFLVMEYLEGETLSQRLRRGPLPTAEVLRYSIELAGALNTAHRKGVVHRDLKPGNIMLTETGAKLLDFGLAKRAGGAGAPRTLIGAEEGSGTIHNALRSARSTQSASLTEAGMILGTLEYMAPEQLEAKEADARTDLFALGVVIYEMATGQKAFEGDSKASLIAKILTFQPPPIGTIQPVSPPELDRVVQRCLAKKPEERWQSATELTSQLQEIAEANLEILKAQKKGKEASGEAKEIESKAEPAIPVGGGPPERVLSGEKIKNFSCAREANLCVVAEEVEGKQVLTKFDPLNGRGEKLPMSDYPESRTILSPQGRLVENMKSGPDGLYINHPGPIANRGDR